MTNAPNNEHDDRHFDGLLREAAGDAPSPDLLARTMAAIDEGPAEVAATKPRRLPAVLVAIAAAAIVSVIAWWQPGKETADPTSNNSTLQDPKLSPPPVLVGQLADEEKVANARAQLLRHGGAAVPALRTAIGNKDAAHKVVFDVLRLLEVKAVDALPDISKFILDAKVTNRALGKAFQAAAEIAPFATKVEQERARRAVLITGFSKAGPAAPAGNAAIGGPRTHTFSLRDIGRIQHRLALGGNASTERCLDALANGSPFERELAARLLRDHRDPRIVPALRKALASEHPEQIQVTWENEASSGNFAFSHQHDGVIHLFAARSLAKLAGASPEAAAAHAHLLTVGSIATQRRSATALAHTEAPKEDRTKVSEALANALKSTDVQVLREVVTALGHYGPVSSDTLVKLVELSQHKDAQVRARLQAMMKRLAK